MHLLIPHASALDTAARHAFSGLALPNLAALLARLTPTDTWGSDEFSPHPPHHVALAALHGQAEPSAAAWAVEAGPELAWALMTPVHLAVGNDGVDVLPPTVLNLSESDATRFVALLRELWPEAEGWQWRVLGATRWAIGHATALDGLHAASIERAAGQPIAPWLSESRVLRRWQNEAQMLMHGHALNDAREARGEHPINSVWLGDIGRSNGRSNGRPGGVTVDTRLTEPLLAGDLAAWAEAWQRLDAGPLAALAQDPQASLTLCGERLARRFSPQPLSFIDKLKRRFQTPDVAAVMEAL